MQPKFSTKTCSMLPDLDLREANNARIIFYSKKKNNLVHNDIEATCTNF
jgi:hypothetical protein